MRRGRDEKREGAVGKEGKRWEQRGRTVKRKWFRKWRGSKTENQGNRQRDGGTKRLDES